MSRLDHSSVFIAILQSFVIYSLVWHFVQKSVKLSTEETLILRAYWNYPTSWLQILDEVKQMEIFCHQLP